MRVGGLRRRLDRDDRRWRAHGRGPGRGAAGDAAEDAGGGDAALDGASAGSTVSFRFGLLEADDPTMRPPAVGAVVAIDPPGGGARMQATTDPTGHVSFDGIDWSAGTLDVTAYLDGYGAATMVLTEALYRAQARRSGRSLLRPTSRQ